MGIKIIEDYIKQLSKIGDCPNGEYLIENMLSEIDNMHSDIQGESLIRVERALNDHPYLNEKYRGLVEQYRKEIKIEN